MTNPQWEGCCPGPPETAGRPGAAGPDGTSSVWFAY